MATGCVETKSEEEEEGRVLASALAARARAEDIDDDPTADGDEVRRGFGDDCPGAAGIVVEDDDEEEACTAGGFGRIGMATYCSKSSCSESDPEPDLDDPFAVADFLSSSTKSSIPSPVHAAACTRITSTWKALRHSGHTCFEPSMSVWDVSVGEFPQIAQDGSPRGFSAKVHVSHVQKLIVG